MGQAPGEGKLLSTRIYMGLDIILGENKVVFLVVLMEYCQACRSSRKYFCKQAATAGAQE